VRELRGETESVVHDLLPLREKARARRAFFFFYSISSEYQVRTDFLPDFGGNFGVEVLLYHGLLLSSGAAGLDTISTERGISACSLAGSGDSNASATRESADLSDRKAVSGEVCGSSLGKRYRGQYSNRHAMRRDWHH
jgi:hypothetical protein